jgi:hypothetical protein
MSCDGIDGVRHGWLVLHRFGPFGTRNGHRRMTRSRSSAPVRGVDLRRVVGYVRISSVSGFEGARWRDLSDSARRTVARHCERHRLPLSHVVVDRYMVDDGLLGRVGFAAVLGIAAPSGTHAVVVPSLDHLSTDRDMRMTLTSLLVETGAHGLPLPLPAGGGRPGTSAGGDGSRGAHPPAMRPLVDRSSLGTGARRG